MSNPGLGKRINSKGGGRKPFRHLVLLLDCREPGHILIDLKATPVQPQAWRLLMCLAESPGSVVPYEDLYEYLWGETVVEMNQLSYQKNALLSAMSSVSPERSEVIQTFPKVGFMLDLSPREVLIVPGQANPYSGSARLSRR